MPTAAEQRSTDEGRGSGEARSRTYSFELQRRREGQQQCAVCPEVSHSPECSRGARCGGGVGETGGTTGAAVGLGVGQEVVDKAAASLEKECETLRIVVQALREKEEDSQASADVARATGGRGLGLGLGLGLGVGLGLGLGLEPYKERVLDFLVVFCRFCAKTNLRRRLCTAAVSCKLPGTMNGSLPIIGDDSARQQL